MQVFVFEHVIGTMIKITTKISVIFPCTYDALPWLPHVIISWHILDLLQVSFLVTIPINKLLL